MFGIYKASAWAALSAVALLTATPAAADGCYFKGPVLYCLDGDRALESVLKRFASEETTKALEIGPSERGLIADRAARERYRVSLERNNARAIQYVKAADRASRAGHIDDATFEERMALYRKAYANYRMGIRLYEEAIWFDPVQDEPEGPNLTDDAVTVRG